MWTFIGVALYLFLALLLIAHFTEKDSKKWVEQQKKASDD